MSKKQDSEANGLKVANPDTWTAAAVKGYLKGLKNGRDPSLVFIRSAFGWAKDDKSLGDATLLSVRNLMLENNAMLFSQPRSSGKPRLGTTPTFLTNRFAFEKVLLHKFSEELLTRSLAKPRPS